MAARKRGRKQQTVTVRRPSTEEIRKAIEDARGIIDSMGPYKMESGSDGYTIRLSRRIRCRVTYDTGTGEIVLVLPNGRQCGVGEGNEREMALLKMCVAEIENLTGQLEYARAMLKRAEGELARSWRSQTCMDGELARENARLSRRAWDLENRIQDIEMQYGAMSAEANRIIQDDRERLEKARDAKRRAEEKRKKATEELQKTKEEMKRTKSRNSRLAAEANKIDTRNKKYKTPKAGKKGGRRKGRQAPATTAHRTADQTRCHECRAPMGNITERRGRVLEEIEDGRYEVVEYDTTRRWCPGCKRLRHTPIPGALPGQRFGNRILAMMSFLKMIGVSFRKIEMVFLAFYNVHISTKTIQGAVRKVSSSMERQYEAIQDHILDSRFVGGDETSWRVMGLPYWVWVVVCKDAVWFNIQEGRGSDEAKAMLPGYGGGVGSDSLGAWNHVGEWHQKCHLHYKRDMERTMRENGGAEFARFARLLRRILWDSHTPQKGYDPGDDLPTRRRKQRNLLRRLRHLMERDYADKDCIRYLKRLRREFYHLFSHVIYGIDWHNNASERAVRCFVLLRHIMHGNRTEADAKTYAVLLSIVGTSLMRGANPLDYMVDAMSRPKGSPVELPRPPTDPK